MVTWVRTMLDTLFKRSRVVNDLSDVQREAWLWLKVLVIDTVIFFLPVSLALAGIFNGDLWEIMGGVVLSLFGVLFIVASFGSYIFAPILLPLGYEFVCMDLSFGFYGWVHRPAKSGETNE